MFTFFELCVSQIINIAIMVGFSIVQALFSTVTAPAKNAILAHVLPKADIMTGRTGISVMMNKIQIIGYALAGVVMEPTFNFNLGYLFDFSGMNVMQNLLNFMFFIPLGWFACTLNQRYAVSLPIVIACVVASVIGIELIQYFSLRGIFDIVDIVLNVAGIMSGYYLTRYTIQTLQLKKV